MCCVLLRFGAWTPRRLLHGGLCRWPASAASKAARQASQAQWPSPRTALPRPCSGLTPPPAPTCRLARVAPWFSITASNLPRSATQSSRLPRAAASGDGPDRSASSWLSSASLACQEDAGRGLVRMQEKGLGRAGRGDGHCAWLACLAALLARGQGCPAPASPAAADPCPPAAPPRAPAWPPASPRPRWPPGGHPPPGSACTIHVASPSMLRHHACCVTIHAASARPPQRQQSVQRRCAADTPPNACAQPTRHPAPPSTCSRPRAQLLTPPLPTCRNWMRS